MSKQSSIEWLIDNLYLKDSLKWEEILEQAKSMHKEECIKYYVDTIDYGDMGQHIRESFIQIAEKMYNKTFNTKEK